MPDGILSSRRLLYIESSTFSFLVSQILSSVTYNPLALPQILSTPSHPTSLYLSPPPSSLPIHSSPIPTPPSRTLFLPPFLIPPSTSSHLISSHLIQPKKTYTTFIPAYLGRQTGLVRRKSGGWVRVRVREGVGVEASGDKGGDGGISAGI